MRTRRLLLLLTFWLLRPVLASPIDGFHPLAPFNEQLREQAIDDVRLITIAADSFDEQKPTLLIFYALPVGNSLEHTVGCREAQGRDWHYIIQNIGAQTRALQVMDTDENIVVVYLEANA